MKKFLCGLLCVCIILSMLGTAVAATVPTASFAAAQGVINGGLTYHVAVRLSQAQANDVTVTVKNGQNGRAYDVVIPAGKTEAVCSVPTDAVSEKTRTQLTLEPSGQYKSGGKHSLTVYSMPRMVFESAVMTGALGKKVSVSIKCYNQSSILKGSNVFVLKGSDGVVLAERSWPIGQKTVKYTFEVTEAMLGRQDLTLWLGDQKVSVEDGYLSLANVSEKVVQKTEPQVPLMAIGIDCAYFPEQTDAFLAVLEKHNVKITFFMTGYFMRDFTEYAQKIVAAGHEVGNHSSTHEHMTKMNGYNQYRQIMRPVEDAEKLLGVTPRLFRPPFGEFNSNVSSLARGEGMEMIMWTVDCKDSFEDYTPARVLKRLTTGFDYQPGTILLGHLDGIGMPDVLDQALTYYESLGLQVVPISALLYASGRELPAMPSAREPLVYTDEYWPNWLRENVPEYAWALDQ